MSARRWERAIDHHGGEVEAFAAEYFGQADRRVLLIAGAGFDPRATHVARLLSGILGERLKTLLLREERPRPESGLLALADANESAIRELVASHEVARIPVFDDDDAVISGRSAMTALAAVPLDGHTDVVIDVSALSVGVSFPAVKYLLGKAAGTPSLNLHVVASANSEIDDLIIPVGSEAFETVFGFRGRWKLDETEGAAKLWLPQLARGQVLALRKIHDQIAPDETAPILPFPARRPRRGDDLLNEYSVEVMQAWEVDPANIVYADEDNPLDLYRTVLRIEDAREPVFRDVGGSLLFLSPTGSKALAIGVMMAAIERDFPVAYVEPTGYRADPEALRPWIDGPATLVHVWLHGEAYAEAEPVLP
jgi:hypothetical protein